MISNLALGTAFPRYSSSISFHSINSFHAKFRWVSSEYQFSLALGTDIVTMMTMMLTGAHTALSGRIRAHMRGGLRRCDRSRRNMYSTGSTAVQYYPIAHYRMHYMYSSIDIHVLGKNR